MSGRNQGSRNLREASQAAGTLYRSTKLRMSFAGCIQGPERGWARMRM